MYIFRFVMYKFLVCACANFLCVHVYYFHATLLQHPFCFVVLYAIAHLI